MPPCGDTSLSHAPYCVVVNGRVNILDVSDIALKGTIPESVGNMDKMINILISTNELVRPPFLVAAVAVLLFARFRVREMGL